MGKVIEARRSVYETAEELEKRAIEENVRPHELVRGKINECRAAGDTPGVRFWQDVGLHVRLIEQGMRDVIPLEDDL